MSVALSSQKKCRYVVFIGPGLQVMDNLLRYNKRRRSQARLRVSESTIERIKSLNRLDMELYEYAQDIFARQHDRTMQKLETEGIVVLNSMGAPPWRESLLAMAVVLVGVCLFINARRRTSKVKV